MMYDIDICTLRVLEINRAVINALVICCILGDHTTQFYMIKKAIIRIPMKQTNGMECHKGFRSLLNGTRTLQGHSQPYYGYLLRD